MSALGTLQSDFCVTIFSQTEDDNFLAQHCVGPLTRTRSGMSVYRRSILANLANAVATSYPLLQKIVGADFLDEAIRQYVLSCPSQSGYLNAYGDRLGAFMATYLPAAELPWLPAVAEMEWEIQRTHGAPDAPAVDLAALEATTPEHWENLVFALDPGHALIESNWPLAHIWQLNQPGYAGEMHVDFDIPQCVLVHRKGYDTNVELLTRGEFAFLNRLAQNASLGLAVDAAVAADAHFDFGATLQRFIASSLIRCAFLPEQS